MIEIVNEKETGVVDSNQEQSTGVEEYVVDEKDQGKQIPSFWLPCLELLNTILREKGKVKGIMW